MLFYGRNFRVYKNMFLFKIYMFKDRNVSHWKEMFIDGLPRSFMANKFITPLPKHILRKYLGKPLPMPFQNYRIHIRYMQ